MKASLPTIPLDSSYTHSPALLTMSDCELAAKNYTIESVSWKGQYVSVNDNTIVGFRHLIGGIQEVCLG